MTTVTLAPSTAPRGGGRAIIILPMKIAQSAELLRVTRYQLMIWMVASGHLILSDGLSRCDRDWFAVTRSPRRATLLHLQRRVTRCLQRVAPFSGHPR